MATNATLIHKMRQIIQLEDAAQAVRNCGWSASEQTMHNDIMINASHLDDVLVTMCTELRRLCAEPYGDAK
jgi:hypothetical protein